MPVHQPEPDPPLHAGGQSSCALDGIAREAERPREHARPTARNEPDGRARVDSVQHLVERPVAAVDVDRPDRGRHLAGDLGRLAATGRDPHDGCARKSHAHGCEQFLRDSGRKRVDDQDPAHRPTSVGL